MLWMAEQESLRGAHQFAALAGVDRSRAATECRSGAVTDFDEDQRFAIQHHQVELAAARLGIAREQAQAVPLQEAKRRGFHRIAAGAAIE